MITRALETVGKAVRQQFIDHASSLVAEHVRQMHLAQKQHAEDVGKLEAQPTFWREKALAPEESEDVTPTEPAPEIQRCSPSEAKQTTRTATGKKPGGDEESPASHTQDTDTQQPKML